MAPEIRIAVLGTGDTKRAEMAFLASEIRGSGAVAIVMDVGVAPTPPGAAEVTSDQVALAGGRTLQQVGELGRDRAMAAMGAGAGVLLRRQRVDGRLDGVIAVGGNQGTAVAAIAMRALPVGCAKLIVSTVASGNVRPYVADSDIVMQFSVADLMGGPNAVTAPVLRSAAAAVVAMAATGRDAGPPVAGPVASVTTFGNTEPAALVAMSALRDAGFHVVPFHASGACGSAMERLIDEGRIHAVLDLTTHEVLAEAYPVDIYTPARPGRLSAAGRAGIPQVVVPGGLEYFCFGPRDDIPAGYRGRPVHMHNPYNTNVRANRSELAAVGRLLAQRLNDARGPVAAMVPTHGWSQVGSPGGVLHDPEANAALVTALREDLRPDLPITEVPTTINDPQFAAQCAATLIRMYHQQAPVAGPGVRASADTVRRTT